MQKELCVRGNQPRNFNNAVKQSKAQNDKSNILTCSKTERKPKTNLNKHI